MRLAFVLACFGIWAVAFGCATGEDLDNASGGSAGHITASGGEVGDANAGAGGSVGGASGSGGAIGGGGGSGGSDTGGSGGGSASGGGGSSGSAGSAGGCAAGEKLCDNVCIAPQPAVGCSLTKCEPCSPPPVNSVAECNGGLCDFNCVSGYVKQGGQCVSTGTGGASGTGGTGGVGGSGGSGGGSGGTGGATGCPQACDPNQGEQQFVCTFLCAFQQKFGACAPVLNCCVCFGSL